MLAPGTPCFLVRLEEKSEFNGRIVTVVSPMASSEDDEYEVHASWARELFPDGMMAARKNLLPITPPEKPKTRERKRELQK